MIRFFRSESWFHPYVLVVSDDRDQNIYMEIDGKPIALQRNGVLSLWYQETANRGRWIPLDKINTVFK